MLQSVDEGNQSRLACRSGLKPSPGCHYKLLPDASTLLTFQLESVRLAYFNGYTYSEVATLLDKPLPTIKTRMRDGLIRLRDCLEGAR